MKKTLAIVLTLALLVTLAAPVFAAEARARVCPACGGSAYEEMRWVSTRNVGVPSCDYYVGMHNHTVGTYDVYSVCEDCYNEVYLRTTTVTNCPYD